VIKYYWGLNSMNNNILVVGGAGYIGTHMVKRLIKDGFNVIVLDNLSTGHAELIPGGTLVTGDMADRALLKQVFKEHHVDAVMHFAAFIEVGESVQDPLKYYDNNFIATVNLIQTMIQYNVLRLIFSSSAAVYGEPEKTPIDESHPLNPTSPYGETKLYVEKMLTACDEAYGLRSISLRYFNAAGADESASIGERHQPESHLIPLVLQTALGQRKEINIFGNDFDTADGTAVRDYIHVNDLADAHVLALKGLLDGIPTTCYNLGNSKGYSVKDVIDTARNITGRDIRAIETAKRKGDPGVLVASSNKIKQELGWQPEYTNLENIVKSAWEWHRKGG
jgi:UDP-glucose 4-epimerase